MIDVSLLGGAFPPPVAAVAPIAVENPVARESRKPDEVGGSRAFGPAYVLSLSPQAEAAMNGYAGVRPASENTVLQNYQLSTRPPRGPGEPPALGAQGHDGPPPPPPPGGGRSGVAMEKDSVTYEEVEDTQERAKRKIRPLVGSVGADQIVDEKGNVDKVKLRELMARYEELANRFKPDHVTYAAISLVS